MIACRPCYIFKDCKNNVADFRPSSAVDCALQDDIAKQAQYIEELQQAVAAKQEQLQLSQAQLEATQSSLIDLESHLTSLEEDEQPPPMSTEPPVSSNEAERKMQVQSLVDMARAEELDGTSDQEDSIASIAAAVFDDMFPVSSESDSDSTAEESDLLEELHEDPYELFEKGKAAVEARGKPQAAQPQSQQMPLSAQPQSDLQSSVSSQDAIDSLNNQSSDQGKGNVWCQFDLAQTVLTIEHEQALTQCVLGLVLEHTHSMVYGLDCCEVCHISLLCIA